MCDENLTNLPWAIRFRWIHLLLFPVSLASFAFPFVPASISFVSSHSAHEAVSFETTFALALFCKQYVYIALLIFHVLIRVVLMFTISVFETFELI